MREWKQFTALLCMLVSVLSECTYLQQDSIFRILPLLLPLNSCRVYNVYLEPLEADEQNHSWKQDHHHP